MKILRLVLAAALVLPGAGARAEENRYDLLGRTLMPFVSVFAKKSASGHRAMTLTARVELMTGLAPELLGASAELVLQSPDKLRLSAPVLGERLVICRRGQELWVHPGTTASALLAAASAGKTLPPADPKYRLEPFQLPVPEKQLVLLPMLFQARDVGTESLDGASCRVLDLHLMPELARALKAEGWAARVWVRGDATPARLSIAKTGWQLAVRFERVEFSPRLPDSTWQPTAEQAGDVRKLTPAEYQQLLGTLVK